MEKARGVNWGCVGVIVLTLALWAIIAVVAWLISCSPAAAATLPGCCVPASGAPYAPSLLFGGEHGCGADPWIATACAGPTPASEVTPTPTPALGNCYSGGICYPSAPPCMAGVYIPPGEPCPPGGATPTPTPTPTASATATPTPTAPAMPTPTITTVTLGLPIPWTYTQGLTLFRGVLWGDAGNPTSGPNQGECIFSLDYNRQPPAFRVWSCTGWTPDSWEGAYPKVDDDPANGNGALIVAWIETRSPAPWGQTRGDAIRYGTITTLRARPVAGQAGSTALDDPAPYITRDAIAESEAWIWPLGWLHLGGQRMLYAAHVSALWGAMPHALVRYYWPQHGGVWMDTLGMQPAVTPTESISDIAIDEDGSLIATEYTGDNATELRIWRSRDEGQTWAVATTVQAQPGGSLFDCHFAHGAGGAAQVPWLLTCNSTPPTGSWANGGWSVVSVAWPGAQMPLYWGQTPTQSKVINPLPNPRPAVRLGIGPAPLSQLDVVRMLAGRKP